MTSIASQKPEGNPADNTTTVTKPAVNYEDNNLDVYLRLLAYVRPYLGYFLFSVLGYVIVAAVQPLLPELLKHIVNAIDHKDVDARWTLPWMAVGIFAIQGLGSFLGAYYMAWVTGTVVRNVQKELFDKMTTLPAQYFDSTPRGQILARINNSVGMMSSAIGSSVVVAIREGLTVVGLLVYIFYKNWQLSLTFIAIAPFIALLVRYTGNRFHKISHKMQVVAGETAQVTNEMISGYRVMRSFGGERYEKTRFAEACANSFRQALKMQKTGAINTPVMQLIVSFAVAVIVFLILQPMFLDKNNAGELVAYITAVALLPKPIRQLSEINGAIQKGIAGAQKVFEIMDMDSEVDAGTYHCDRVRGDVVFRGVGFRYPNTDVDVLKQIDCHIQPGQTVALVGHSGSGKSTLVSLLPRFYDATSGEIMLDGVPVQDYTLANLRRQVSLVTQNVVLFHDTIACNIAYGDLSSCSREQIIAAAEAANAMEFIQQQPQGLDTPIGENGLKLSGGQRQRLAIARALLKDAPVLILDEATSALDNESEAKIQQALERVMQGRTTLVIAHRLSTIENADLILVMDRGEIVERGTHQQLLAMNGHYARLHSAGFEEAPAAG